ncbi:hypothetical protein MKW92_021138 [Papaver armeniacum]|nr:hypothetical protein MKW92_021138 [Papaver armeniacum]
MAGRYKFSVDQKDIVKFLIATVGSSIQDRLINKEQRIQHKEQCAERLASEEGGGDKESEVQYSEQAVLANLDWDIDALEEVVTTTPCRENVAGLCNVGVLNFYISACAHLNLAFLRKMRNNVHNSVHHILEMFAVDPFFSRIDFSPDSTIGWYSEARHMLVMELIPDCTDLSFTADFDQFFNESLILTMRPDQAEKLQKLKKAIPVLPIAEPPMTPLHEVTVSFSIPDYVKFGPILPTHAGFAPYLKDNENERKGRLNKSSSSTPRLDISPKPLPKGWACEENEDDYDSSYGDTDMDTEAKPCAVTDKMRMNENASNRSEIEPTVLKGHTNSPSVTSPINICGKRVSEAILRHSSSRFSEPNNAKSSPTSPHLYGDVVMKSLYDNFNITIKIDKNEEGNQSFHSAAPSSGKLTPHGRPPKDFICSITGQLLGDPVPLTLETGNTTCPITRQPLSVTLLPKTNYVLKRLITSWKEQYPDQAQEFSYSETPRTPTSNQSSIELPLVTTHLTESSLPNPLFADHYVNKKSNRFMRAAVSTSPTTFHFLSMHFREFRRLCNSCVEDREDMEGLKNDPGVHSYLLKPAIVNGFVEILSASVNREVLRPPIYVLSELAFVDETVGETLKCVDSDIDCLATLLKNGLAEDAVFIFQLRPTYAQLFGHDLIPSLVQVDASIAMLDQILSGGDENSKSINASSIISANGLPSLLRCSDRTEGRQSFVSILLSCMRADRNCRNLIASRAELAHVLELFHAGNDNIKGICIEFLHELVCLNRYFKLSLFPSFLIISDALKELGMYAKSIWKSLRKLKSSSIVVKDILKALMNLSSVNAKDLWSCAEAGELESSANGEVLSLNIMFQLIKEIREHTKAVTCLDVIPSSGDKLYSGSLDKTIRVWTINSAEIHCIEVHDVKEREVVLGLAANARFACFASQATDVKVYNWNGTPRQINSNKNVKCLIINNSKLYCGCTNYSIREVDLSKGTSATFFPGSKKLLGKQAIHAIYIHGDLLFAGGSSVDGSDIHCITANNDFVFIGTKSGITDIYLREQLVRVASIKTGSARENSKITSLISDSDGEMLYAGSRLRWKIK